MLLNESFCSIYIHTNRTNANKISMFMEIHSSKIPRSS